MKTRFRLLVPVFILLAPVLLPAQQQPGAAAGQAANPGGGEALGLTPQYLRGVVKQAEAKAEVARLKRRAEAAVEDYRRALAEEVERIDPVAAKVLEISPSEEAEEQAELAGKLTQEQRTILTRASIKVAKDPEMIAAQERIVRAKTPAERARLVEEVQAALFKAMVAAEPEIKSFMNPDGSIKDSDDTGEKEAPGPKPKPKPKNPE